MKELLTELNDRVLRFDGVSIVEPDQVEALLRQGAVPSQLRVVYETPEIEAFNRHVSLAERLMEFEPEPLSFKFAWQLPPEFLSLDVEEHVSVVFGERLPALEYDSAQTEDAITRVALELQGFRERGLYDLLRVIIFTLHRFRETNQVWGVGRGSSCASYILFLLGLHVVDPIKFEVPLEEFMHD
jgi:DNA polymerase III alpha subunit